MKAGTATKLVLNMISTAVMIRLGHVHGNLMVNVQPKNSKLEDRARRIIAQEAEVSYERAGELLREAGEDVKVAIVMARLRLDRGSAEAKLGRAGGRISEALKNLAWTNSVFTAASRLQGEIAISGAKNSALPALAACLLTDEPVVLRRIPQVRDIRTMEQLLEYSGALHRAGQRL